MHKKRNFSKMGFLENFGLGYYKEPKGEHWVDSIGKKPFLTKKGFETREVLKMLKS